MSIVTRNMCLNLKLLGRGMDELNPHNDLVVILKCICRDTLTESKKLVRVFLSVMPNRYPLGTMRFLHCVKMSRSLHHVKPP
jgi:hypothetical protein